MSVVISCILFIRRNAFILFLWNILLKRGKIAWEKE